MELTWTSVAGWLMRAGVGGSLLIVGTLLAMRWVRQPARRQRLGELGMAAALVLAALCWAPAWLPIWQPAPQATPSPLNFIMAPVEEHGDFEFIGELPPEAVDVDAIPWAIAEAAPAAATVNPADWLLPVVVIAYGLGAAFCLTRWLAGVVALWRIVRAARPAAPELLSAFHSRLTTQRRPRLLISSRLQVPASCGVFRPTLILPEALAGDDCAAEREWVFDHELTHLARRDAWSAVLFALGQMCYFALPWFWWLKRVVRLCQEYVADAAACRRRPADEYAEFLLSLTSAPAAPLAATGVTGSPSDLYRRVTMLLQNPVRVELSCPRVWTVGAAGVLLGLAVIAAGVGPAQAQQPNQKEVLEQLERIQDMVNKLRHQLAQPAKDDAKKPQRELVIELVAPPDKGKKHDRDFVIELVAPKDQVKKATDAAIKDAISTLQKAKALGTDAEKQQYQARLELAHAALLALQAEAQGKQSAGAKGADKEKKRVELERTIMDHERALADYHRALAVRIAQKVEEPRAAADKELKAVIELLQKHLADLKDADPNSKKLIEDAVNRLKDAMKKHADVAPAIRVPMVLPPQPALPGKPAVPATPKPGVVVTLPQVPQTPVAPQQALAVLGGADQPARVWATLPAPSTGRLGIRVDAPGAALAEQLNLPKDQGLVVAEVFDNSVAKKAGLKVNDILLKINQQPVSNEPEKLIKLVADIKADAPFDIVVLRRGKQETIQNVRLAESATARLYATRFRNLSDLQGVQIAITVKKTGNSVTVHRNEGETAITLKADLADGKSKVTGITVVEKGKTTKYTSVNEVPEPTRAKVQHLMQLLDAANLSTLRDLAVPMKAAPKGGVSDIDLYYRTPQGTKPTPEAFRFELKLDNLDLPLPNSEGAPQLDSKVRERRRLAVPDVNLELPQNFELHLALPKLANPQGEKK